MKFIPTGGISQNNILEYLGFPAVIACGGSWMVKPDMVAGGRLDEVARLTAEAVQLVRCRA